MSDRGDGFFKGFVIGGIIGAVAGILLAPKSGRETREDLGEEAGEDLMEEVYQRHRFDLCDECFHQYKNDPLGGGSVQPVRFSQN